MNGYGYGYGYGRDIWITINVRLFSAWVPANALAEGTWRDRIDSAERWDQVTADR
jgi:hypothetical protein